VFFGEWVLPPDALISMPSNRVPLVLYVLIYVDDELVITNSPSLYHWFLATL
jgi:hypothetical protein